MHANVIFNAIVILKIGYWFIFGLLPIPKLLLLFNARYLTTLTMMMLLLLFLLLPKLLLSSRPHKAWEVQGPRCERFQDFHNSSESFTSKDKKGSEKWGATVICCPNGGVFGWSQDKVETLMTFQNQSKEELVDLVLSFMGNNVFLRPLGWVLAIPGQGGWKQSSPRYGLLFLPSYQLQVMVSSRMWVLQLDWK